MKQKRETRVRAEGREEEANLNRLGILAPAPAVPGRRGLRGAGDAWTRHCAQAAGVGAPPSEATAPPHCACSSTKSQSAAELNLTIHHKVWLKITVA